MNKTLKFQPHLIPLILNGSKTSTWRLWDDKNLMVDDTADFLNSDTKEIFVTVKLNKITEKSFKEMTPGDMLGNGLYSSTDEMIQTFENIYHKSVTLNTKVKIIWFHILSPLRR